MVLTDKVIEFYESGLVERWHNRPQIPTQTNASHSFGMLQLLMQLHPHPSYDLIMSIIRHDLPEYLCGDFPHSAKKGWPELKRIDAEAADNFADIYNLPELYLTEIDKLWLRFLDQLEPLHWLAHNKLEDTQIYKDTYKNCVEMEKQIGETIFLDKR